MEKNLNHKERRPYVRPEANLWLLRLGENIAISGSDQDEIVVWDDEFDGEDHDFE